MTSWIFLGEGGLLDRIAERLPNTLEAWNLLARISSKDDFTK